MNYFIRKAERYTVWEATEPVALNPEDFKTISFPFTGNSEEDFVNYIDKIYMEEDWYEIADELEQKGFKEAANALSNLFEGEASIYSDTRHNSADEWLDIGEPNEAYRKMGRFKVNHHTRNDNW